MDTLLIEITNQKAIGLLHELEELHLIKVIKEEKISSKKRLSDKYKGILTLSEKDSLNNHIQKIRSEWSNI